MGADHTMKNIICFCNLSSVHAECRYRQFTGEYSICLYAVHHVNNKDNYCPYLNESKFETRVVKNENISS